MNTLHITPTGTVTLIGGEWRDGAFPKARPGVACITVHDDATNAVWRYTGPRRAAAEFIGRLYVGTREAVAVFCDNHIEIETPPTDLWTGVGEPDDDGEFERFEFKAAAHPEIVAY